MSRCRWAKVSESGFVGTPHFDPDRAITLRKQQYYRASISLLEQQNGFYTVWVTERWEGGRAPDPIEYPNLTWAEVKDVVASSFDVFSDSRTRQFSRLDSVSWNQESIFD